jgi:hypothetical protein
VTRLAVAQVQDVVAWAATDAGGQPVPADELAVVAGADERLGHPVGAVVAAEPVAGHRVQATVPAADLRPFDDLELWVRADRAADGSSGAPWYLELRLGSAVRPVGADGNAWQRFLPLRADGRWELVALALGDLPDAVRQAVTAVRLTCVDDSAPFRVAIDGPWATRAATVADVDDALRSLLDGVLQIGGNPVPLAFEPGPLPDAQPFLRARQVGTKLRPELAPGVELRTDHTGERFALRPPAVPVELAYELWPDAASRDDEAAILEFALRALASTADLDVAGRPSSLDLVDLRTDTAAVTALTVAVVTSLRPPAPAIPAVPPFHAVDVEVDSLAV